MKKVHKAILTLILMTLLFNINVTASRAEDNFISYNEVPNSERIVSLRYTNKPLSLVLKELAYKASFNLIVLPDFKDGNISISLSRVKVCEALKDLMNVGNFNLQKKDNLIIVTTTSIPKIVNEIIPLEYSQAAQVAYTLDKMTRMDENNSINYDDITNSIILKGNKEFIDSTKKLAQKIDLPKKHFTTSLQNSTSTQVADLLKSQFEEKVSINKTEPQSNEVYLEPIQEKGVSLTLKGMVEKQDPLALYAEKPIIIPDEEYSQITVIGNANQVALAKELINYLENKNTDSEEELTRTQNELWQTQTELEQTKFELKEAQLLLSDAALGQVESNLKLTDSQKRLEELTRELNKLKTKEIWDNLLSKPSTNADKNQKVEELNSQIKALQETLASKDASILQNVELKRELEEKIIQQNKELELANSQLIKIKEQLAEYTIKKDMATSDNDAKDTFKMLALTQNELITTKNDLNRVKQQLEISKKQLEMIFGGTLLESNNPPNDKSRWFK